MLPTLYELYTSGGIHSGLSEKFDSFALNNRTITILSGSMHYFRVPREYWRDRLRKVRAAGLNSIETYIPWNLHEPQDGMFDFGGLQNSLNIEHFLTLVQEEDLLAIVRVGPYICSEMDFGGMPSWLLRKPIVKLRSSEGTFSDYFKRFFSVLMSVLTTLQFSNGGPIIGFQVENEYLQFDQEVDGEYLRSLVYILLDFDVKEMIFLAEDPTMSHLFLDLPKVLYVGSFGKDVKLKLGYLKSYLNGRPSMVMEYWTGWYDVWLRNRGEINHTHFKKDLKYIFKSHSSFNLYMFVGGTTYGFLNGATFSRPNSYDVSPISNSYDFTAPINEAGDYTRKYFIIREMIKKYTEVNTRTPEILVLKPRMAYKPIRIISEIKLFDLLPKQKTYYYKKLIPMEYLPINNNSGQSYGYIIYRRKNLNVSVYSRIRISESMGGFAMILINGKLISKPLISKVDIYNFGYWEAVNSSLMLDRDYPNATLDIIVVNLGRASYGDAELFQNQRKGLREDSVFLNDIPLVDWEIIPMEFKQSWINNLREWKKPTFSKGPCLYKAVLTLGEKWDTFVDMSSWHMGIVIVNGFVLSRYLRLGPTQTAFLPAPFLKIGENEIVIFEHFTPYKFVTFLGEEKRRRHEPFDVPVFAKNFAVCFGFCYTLRISILLSLTL